MSDVNQQWILAERPTGMVRSDVFQLREVPIAPPKDGEVLIRTHMISLDPALRLMIGLPTPDEEQPYVAPGEVMFGFAVGEVIESRARGLKVGDIVDGRLGWQTYLTTAEGNVRKRNSAYSFEELLSVLGVPGMTAYYGMVDIIEPKQNETVVVSSAAGAVGTIAGQIAKIHGCKAIGIAGGKKKCAWIVDELGFDDAIDYKAGDLDGQLVRACGGGIDAYFDNVGGEILQAVAHRMKIKARVAVCGVLSLYNDENVPHGLRRLFVTVILKELKVFGFTLAHFIEQQKKAEEQLVAWMRVGRLKAPVVVRDGFEELPAALVSLFKGENQGKLMVRVYCNSGRNALIRPPTQRQEQCRTIRTC